MGFRETWQLLLGTVGGIVGVWAFLRSSKRPDLKLQLDQRDLDLRNVGDANAHLAVVGPSPDLVVLGNDPEPILRSIVTPGGRALMKKAILVGVPLAYGISYRLKEQAKSEVFGGWYEHNPQTG